MNKNEFLNNLAGVINDAVKEKEWEENLQAPLRNYFNDVKRGVDKLNSLLKAFGRPRVFSRADLEMILFTWRSVAKFIAIKEVLIEIDGRGYAEYGGVRFESLVELENYINHFDISDPLQKVLMTDNHVLKIKIN